ncbi:MAG: ATP-binding protein [Zetaproteobacteria bacterium]|nr:ATP-binding protein [Zetaproteobacteria bacterium]
MNQLFNIRQTISDILSIYASEAESKSILLADAISSDVPAMIESDQKRLKQILMNLINNALKFTEKGSIVVSVKTVHQSCLKFEIQDTGRGISPEEAKQIFIPFSQSKMEDMEKGTGLGLVVCQKLSTLLGGEIGATPRPDGGSNFWFTIRPQYVLKQTQRRMNLSSYEAVILSNCDEFRKIIATQLQVRNISSQGLSLREFLQQDPQQDTMILGGQTTHNKFAVIDDKNLSLQTIAQIEEHMHKSDTPANFPVIYYSNKGTWRRGIRGKIPFHGPELLANCAQLWGEKPTFHNRLDLDSHLEKLSLEELKDKKFLIVDDDPINRKILVRMLNQSGLQSEQATNGKEALHKLSPDHSFAAVFMDCSMPIMDGYQATHKIREQGDMVTIVALTAHAFEEDRRKCLEAGMDLFVSKPVRSEDVQDTLEKVISLKRKSVA